MRHSGTPPSATVARERTVVLGTRILLSVAVCVVLVVMAITTLESFVHAILTRTSSQIVTAVRASIADEMSRLIGAGVGPSSPAVAAPVAKRRGRPPGRPNKVAAAAAPAPKATAAKSPPARHAKRGRGRQTFSAADVASVLKLIASKPGQSPGAYRGASQLSPKVFKNVVVKLKADKKVTVLGVGKGTTYTVG